MKAEVISFRKDINPNSSETLRERVKADGSLIEIRVRFYPGQERSLQIRPFVQLFNNLQEDVFTYGDGTTENYLSGDDDYFIYPVQVDLKMDDVVCILATNTDSTYAYTCVVDCVIQYFGTEGIV